MSCLFYQFEYSGFQASCFQNPKFLVWKVFSSIEVKLKEVLLSNSKPLTVVQNLLQSFS